MISVAGTVAEHILADKDILECLAAGEKSEVLQQADFIWPLGLMWKHLVDTPDEWWCYTAYLLRRTDRALRNKKVWPAVEALANKLSDGEKVYYRQAEKIIKQAMEGEAEK